MSHAPASGRQPFAWSLLSRQLASLLEDERDLMANSANAAALLWMELEGINWAGFYFRQGDELVLGPFQGKPSCVRIPWGKGVCGVSAAQAIGQRVDDVQAFPGHIACDAASRSEVVVPVFAGDRVVGVIDIDSPNTAHFRDEDLKGLELFAKVFSQATDLSALEA